MLGRAPYMRNYTFLRRQTLLAQNSIMSICTYQSTLFFFFNDWRMFTTAEINKSPNIIGKNQKPNPFVTPLEVKNVKRTIKEKISRITSFKERKILVAPVYSFSAFSLVIIVI